jgi:hypothetical protein
MTCAVCPPKAAEPYSTSNLYGNGTIVGRGTIVLLLMRMCRAVQTMENCQVVPCWESVLRQAGGWQERRAAADEFNKQVSPACSTAQYCKRLPHTYRQNTTRCCNY